MSTSGVVTSTDNQSEPTMEAIDTSPILRSATGDTSDYVSNVTGNTSTDQHQPEDHQLRVSPHLMIYKKVSAAYIVGREQLRHNKATPFLFQTRWIDSQCQSNSEDISLGLVQKRHASYNLLLATTTSLHWQDLCEATYDDRLASTDSLEELQEVSAHYSPSQVTRTSSAEVEAIKTMRFDPKAHMAQPRDLFTCGDGATETKSTDTILSIRLQRVFCASPSILLETSCFRDQCIRKRQCGEALGILENEKQT
ncbi:hypothetical protein GN244_ATG08027 [Phytophthora infestans]|uniref:Uncharacterized protein n=1 Tax=Phytophthora infestans TaxID=4787 RepID=A0A833TBB3_PHYIN|nr:hypothetical protein GN244_ATG08027 [Phytophthora infestans]